MIISLIAAVAENNVIGKNNELPWHLPADMKYFKNTTMGHCVIMGRKNYDSIPTKYRPLEGRTNIVITRQPGFTAPDCLVVNSIEEALELARSKNETEVFVIGGADIYNQTISQADKIYYTKIHQAFDGDAFFPEVNEKEWQLKSTERHEVDEKNKYPFSICLYEKKLKT